MLNVLDGYRKGGEGEELSPDRSASIDHLTARETGRVSQRPQTGVGGMKRGGCCLGGLSSK